MRHDSRTNRVRLIEVVYQQQWWFKRSSLQVSQRSVAVVSTKTVHVTKSTSSSYAVAVLWVLPLWEWLVVRLIGDPSSLRHHLRVPGPTVIFTSSTVENISERSRGECTRGKDVSRAQLDCVKFPQVGQKGSSLALLTYGPPDRSRNADLSRKGDAAYTSGIDL